MKSPRRSDLIPQWTHKQLQKRQIQNQLERNDLPEACRIEAVKMQRTVDGRRTESSVYARKKKYDFDEFCLIHCKTILMVLFDTFCSYLWFLLTKPSIFTLLDKIKSRFRLSAVFALFPV